MRVVFEKLFKTWIIGITLIGVFLFSINAIIVIHDSYKTKQALIRAKMMFPEVNPSGDTSKELDKIEKKIIQFSFDNDEKYLFTVGCYHGTKSLFDSTNDSFYKRITTLCGDHFTRVKLSPNDNIVAFGCGYGIGITLKSANRSAEEAVYWAKKNGEKCIKDSNNDIYQNALLKIKMFEKLTKLKVTENYSVYIEGLYGDIDTTNISYLLITSFWLIGTMIVVFISLGLKKWIIWLIEGDKK